MEDHNINFDGSVRTRNGDIIQLAYGNDYLDPSLGIDLSRIVTKINNRKENELFQKKIIK